MLFNLLKQSWKRLPVSQVSDMPYIFVYLSASLGCTSGRRSFPETAYTEMWLDFQACGKGFHSIGQKPCLGLLTPVSTETSIGTGFPY